MTGARVVRARAKRGDGSLVPSVAGRVDSVRTTPRDRASFAATRPHT